MTLHPITMPISTKLKQFKDTGKDPLSAFLLSSKSRSIKFASNWTLSLEGEELDWLSEIVKIVMGYKEIGKKRDEAKVSHDVQALIRKQITDGFADDSARDHAIDTFIESYLNPLPIRTVYFPIAGLQLEEVSLAIGDVLLSPINDESTKRMTSYFERIVNVGGPTGRTKAHLDTILKEYQSSFRDVTLGSFVTDVDTELSLRNGYEAFDDRLDYLAALMPGISRLDQQVWFHVGPPPGTDVINIYSCADAGFNAKQFTLRPIIPITIGQRRLSRLRELGFEVLCKIVSSSSPTAFETRILRMAKWLGRSMRIKGTTEKFLLACNALEAVFTSRGSPISHTLAEGVALLLGREVDEKLFYIERIKKLYETRSGLVHGRGRDVDMAELLELQTHAFSVLCTLLTNLDSFPTGEHGLSDWLQRKKFQSESNLKYPKRYSELPATEPNAE